MSTAKTLVSYEQSLTNVFVVEALRAWTSNRLKVLSLRPSAILSIRPLAAAMLRLDLGAVPSDSNVLGRLLDTFVVAQLRSELAVCETRPRLYYLREEHGRHEIDIWPSSVRATSSLFEVEAALPRTATRRATSPGSGSNSESASCGGSCSTLG